MNVERVGDMLAELGEGPRWDTTTGTLIWVDIPAGAIHRTTPDGHTTTIRRQPPISLALPTDRDALLVAERHRLVLLDNDGATTELAAIDVEPVIRFNDGACDPRGRLWIGTMHTERKPGGACLYRLTEDDVLVPTLREVTVSNGIGWSPDGHTMYYADTPTLRVDAFDYDLDTGTPANRRTFADLRGASGRPDGLTVDSAGYVWVALFAGAALHRYSPDGVLDLVVELPVSHPTSCAFGGDDLRDLYVTTVGPLLRLRAPVPGIAPNRWRSS